MQADPDRRPPLTKGRQAQTDTEGGKSAPRLQTKRQEGVGPGASATPRPPPDSHRQAVLLGIPLTDTSHYVRTKIRVQQEEQATWTYRIKEGCLQDDQHCPECRVCFIIIHFSFQESPKTVLNSQQALPQGYSGGLSKAPVPSSPSSDQSRPLFPQG